MIKMRLILVFAIVTAVFSSGFLLGMSVAGGENIFSINGTMNIPTEGYAKADIQITENTLKLTADCMLISFDVTPDQAFSIFNGIHKQLYIRPLTHDIMNDMIDSFGIKVLQARIDEYNNEIYYAKIFMQQGNNVIEVDARPSDAVALAVRTNTPFYIKKELLKAGEKIC